MSEFSNEEDEERHLVKHMGCMASLFHFFDRPYAPSAPHCRHKFPSSSSSSHSQIGVESVSPSERSEQSGPLGLPEKETVTAASPEPTRASLSAAAFKTTTTWKLREAPRLSLDSRLRPPPPPREIRTSVGNSGQDSSGDDRRSPSVVARLMGVDTLPTGSGPGSPAQLCRSASESRVPREAAYYRFIDPSGFNNAMDYNYNNNNYNTNSYNNNNYGFNGKRVVVVPEPKPDLCVRVSNPNPNLNPIQINPHVPFHRRSSFEPVDCYPDPKRSNGGGEITLYGEIERRLRKRGIDEPCKDLETLKQILEALQLKGLLHSQPADKQSDGRRSFSDDHQQPPPIVLMKPSPRPPRSPRNERPLINRGGRPGHSGAHPKREIDRMVRTTVRSRSPDRGPGSPPVSPNRRRPGCNAASPKKGQLGGNVESPRSPQMIPKQRGISAIRCGKVRPEPLAVRSEKSRRDVRSQVEDDTSSPSVSSSSISTSSGINFERSKLVDEEESNGKSGRHLLERCDKLLSSIAAFTSTDIADSQPSPVSVLDASFLTDESSPSPSSSSSKRLATPPKSLTGNNNIWRTESDSDCLFDSDSDEHDPCTCSVGSESDDQDCLYLREFLRASNRCSDLCKVSELLKKRHLASSSDDDATTLLQRSLIYDSIREIIENVRHVSPWDAFTGRAGVTPHALKRHVWGELQKIREPTVNFSELVDLNEATCRAIEKDFTADQRWSKQSVEISDAVLQIERLVFKDLVADTIKELADAGYTDHYMVPRRKLVF